jgi:hypothetical protein
MIVRNSIIFLTFVVSLTVAGCSNSNSPSNNAVPPVTTQTASTPSTNASPIPGLPTSMPAGSTYTDLNDRVCKDVARGPDDDGIIYKGECPGFAGYKVINLSTDHTQALQITDPTGKKHDVDFRGPLGTATDVFLGDKIEWRTKGSEKDAKPHAFIVRVNVQKEPGNYDKQNSNLAVVKISGDKICVTDFVPPNVKDQNVKARELSDTAATKPCIKSKFDN